MTGKSGYNVETLKSYFKQLKKYFINLNKPFSFLKIAYNLSKKQ